MGSGNHPILFTIFGGTGDLAYRKLLPALYNLIATKMLPKSVEIIVVGRRDYDTQSYVEHIKPWIQEFARLSFSENIFDELVSHLTYIKMNFTDVKDYKVLYDYYNQYPQAQQLYYYAVAPEFFSVISKNLRQCSCLENASTYQVLIEKPFGVDEDSAKTLHKQLLEVFSDESIYRIDHYLGKEMIQNIMSIRFQNTIFKNIWNHHSIDYITISAYETVGVENRGSYYEQTGAIRDMVQNHLFQILSIVLMDEPDDHVESLFKNQVNIIQRIIPIETNHINEHLVLGQYEEGVVDNEEVVGFHGENNVSPTSKTETFAALKLFIDHPQYQGVPVYLLSGKRTKKRSTRVLVVFKPVNNQKPNVLTISISPDEGVFLSFNAKKPGNSQDIVEVSMDFCQSCVYENRLNTPEAYERLLFAAFNKDKSLFTDWQMVLSSWRFVDKLFLAIKQSGIKPYKYKAGSCGPFELEAFFPKNYQEIDTE